MFQAYSSGPKQEEREKVLWVKFEDCDVNGVYSYWLHTHVHMHARTHTHTQAHIHMQAHRQMDTQGFVKVCLVGWIPTTCDYNYKIRHILCITLSCA